MQLHIEFQQLYQFYKWIITLYIIGSSFQSLENQIFYFSQRKCDVIYCNRYFWIGRLETTVIIYPLLKKFRRSVGYKRSNWSLKILAYNENYCEVRTLRDQFVACYFNVEIGLLVQNTKRYLKKLVFLMLSTDLWPLVTWQNMQIKVNDMVQKRD